MNKPLTFLLSLTFLFLFSENSFGIDFGKSEEEKFKGTNIGIHICSQINMDIVDKGFAFSNKTNLWAVKQFKEKLLIRERCTKKHEKIVTEFKWIGGGAHFDKWNKYQEQNAKTSFVVTIKNNSTDKILTSITIIVTYKDKSRESDSFFRDFLYILPKGKQQLSFPSLFTRSEDTVEDSENLEISPSTKETKNLEKPLTGKYTHKDNWNWNTSEGKYVNFVMK